MMNIIAPPLLLLQQNDATVNLGCDHYARKKKNNFVGKIEGCDHYASVTIMKVSIVFDQ